MWGQLSSHLEKQDLPKWNTGSTSFSEDLGDVFSSDCGYAGIQLRKSKIWSTLRSLGNLLKIANSSLMLTFLCLPEFFNS